LQRDFQNAIAAAALLAVIATIGCGEGPTGLFRTAHIDPHTLKMSFTDRLSWPPPAGGGFYERFSASPGYTVLYIAPGGRPDPDIISLTDHSVIATKGSNRVILTGDYGTVYVRTTYFYPPEYGPQPIEFYAELWFSSPNQARPERVGAFDQTADLSAITVVRVFRAPPGFLVVCATYDQDGNVGVLTVNGSRGGEWVHSNELLPLYTDLDVATAFGDRPRTRQYFGLPETFPIADYLHTYRNVSKPVNLQSYQDVINLHYQRNQYVRQDLFSPGGTRKTEFLHYPLTTAYEELKPLDDRMEFGHHHK
jgi:hypothetical protein